MSDPVKISTGRHQRYFADLSKESVMVESSERLECRQKTFRGGLHPAL